MAECKDYSENFPKPEKLTRDQVENIFSNLVKSAPMHCNDIVQVFCRLKPIEANQTPCVTVHSDRTLRINKLETDESKRPKILEYSFNKVFTAKFSQQAVYTCLSFPLLEDLVDGFNSILFVYGLENCGKNHTMIGTPGDPGILPRCLDTIFNTIANCRARKSYFTSNKANGFKVNAEEDKETSDLQPSVNNKKKKNRVKRKEKKDRIKEKTVFFNLGMVIDGAEEVNIFAVFISYVHIYKNNYYDLLDVKRPSVPEAKTTKRDAFHHVYIDNVTEIEARSSSEALSIYNLARARAIVYQASLDPNFRKGHSVLNIRLVQAKRTNRRTPILDDKPRVSQLTIVDLYPWQKNCPEQHRNETQEELEDLQKCINGLHGNRDQMVTPNSKYKVTSLFKQCFKGFTHINMILCVNPAESYYEEIQHALIFAKDIKERRELKIPRQCQNQSLNKKDPLVKWNFTNVVASTAFARRMISTLDEMKPQKGHHDTEHAFLKRRLKDRMVEIRYENIEMMQEKRERRLLKKGGGIYEIERLTRKDECFCSPAEDKTAMDYKSKCVVNKQRGGFDEQIEDIIRSQLGKMNVANQMRSKEIEEIAKKICDIDCPERLDNLKPRLEEK